MFNLILLMATGCSFHKQSKSEETVETIPKEIVKEQNTNDTLKAINVDQLKSLWEQNNILIIDVRTHQEYQQGHIPSAKHIALAKLPQNIASNGLSLEQTIYLVCAVGGRSGQAQKIFKNNGFSNTVNVLGGTQEWAKKGYPLEQK